MCQCFICNKAVNEDNSIGRDCLLMCNECETKIGKKLNMQNHVIFSVVLAMGFLKEKYMEEEAIKAEERKWKDYLALDELAAKSRGLI